jgi:hypothetical protein
MCRPQKRKKDSQVISVFFSLLGSAHVKAAHKYVGEIDIILLFSGNHKQGPISPTFYAQFLRIQIHKAQKRLTAYLYFLCFWDL